MALVTRIRVGEEEILEPGETAELVELLPPEIETPYWEISLKGRRVIYVTGNVLVIIETKDEVEVDQRSWGKITRVKKEPSDSISPPNRTDRPAA